MMNWGKPKEFGPVTVQGRALRCNVCSNATFWEHQVQLATPLFNFLDLEEWNRVAHCAVCERCGYVHMFIPPHTVREEAPDARPEAEPSA
jgi:predicted nucleic-acid-binding Zn-ribbon protein